MTIRNYFYLSIILWLITSTCNAHHPQIKPSSSLLNGTANYQDVLQWSKQAIATNKDFPITIETKCGDMKLLFIQETPTCGVINCHYLIFKQNQATTYFYVGDIDFSAIRLFCYPKEKHYTDYLFSSIQESNATGSLHLGEIKNNHYQPKAIRQIDYTNSKLSEIIESMWEKQPEKKQLLHFFEE